MLNTRCNCSNNSLQICMLSFPAVPEIKVSDVPVDLHAELSHACTNHREQVD